MAWTITTADLADETPKIIFHRFSNNPKKHMCYIRGENVDLSIILTAANIDIFADEFAAYSDKLHNEQLDQIERNTDKAFAALMEGK